MAHYDYNEKIISRFDTTTAGPTAVHNPLVNQACDNIDLEIAELKDLIGKLLDRLIPVSRICAPNDVAKTGSPIKESTPLSDLLEGYAQRILSIRCDVRNALDRLEI